MSRQRPSAGRDVRPRSSSRICRSRGSARASALTQKLNLQAADGTWAWALANHGPHPEDQGSQYALTSDERQTIAVYPMDLGGQYWSRQNTGFVPFTTGDPVTPTIASAAH